MQQANINGSNKTLRPLLLEEFWEIDSLPTYKKFFAQFKGQQKRSEVTAVSIKQPAINIQIVSDKAVEEELIKKSTKRKVDLPAPTAQSKDPYKSEPAVDSEVTTSLKVKKRATPKDIFASYIETQGQ